MGLLALLSGYKTYVAAIGLLGLAVYQFSTGDATNGMHSILAALTAIGLRDAIKKSSRTA